MSTSLVFILFYFFTLCTNCPAKNNAKSINNHNHDHNEQLNTLTSKEETQRIAYETGGGTLMQNKRKSIKRLKIQLRHIYVNSFSKTTLTLKSNMRCVWISTIITFLMYTRLVLHMPALLFGVCTTIYLWSVVLVRRLLHSNRYRYIQFKWQFYQVYNIIFT